MPQWRHAVFRIRIKISKKLRHEKAVYTNWLVMKSKKDVTFEYTPGKPGSAHLKPYDTTPIM